LYGECLADSVFILEQLSLLDSPPDCPPQHKLQPRRLVERALFFGQVWYCGTRVPGEERDVAPVAGLDRAAYWRSASDLVTPTT
jgi:hypothetical protein